MIVTSCGVWCGCVVWGPHPFRPFEAATETCHREPTVLAYLDSKNAVVCCERCKTLIDRKSGKIIVPFHAMYLTEFWASNWC